MDTLGPAILSIIGRLSFLQRYTIGNGAFGTSKCAHPLLNLECPFSELGEYRLYVTRIGNSSCVPVVIVDLPQLAHPFLLNLVHMNHWNLWINQSWFVCFCKI